MTELKKPPHGAPCNGCGLCCRSECCTLSTMLFKTAEGPCTALIEDGDGARCGLVEHPQLYAPIRAAVVGVARLREHALFMIGAGIGCDAHLDDEPFNLAFATQMVRRVDRARRKLDRALAAWGLQQQGLDAYFASKNQRRHRR